MDLDDHHQLQQQRRRRSTTAVLLQQHHQPGVRWRAVQPARRSCSAVTERDVMMVTAGAWHPSRQHSVTAKRSSRVYRYTTFHTDCDFSRNLVWQPRLWSRCHVFKRIINYPRCNMFCPTKRVLCQNHKTNKISWSCFSVIKSYLSYI